MKVLLIDVYNYNKGGAETTPANWEIDEAQERAIQVWAEQNGVWIEGTRTGT